MVYFAPRRQKRGRGRKCTYGAKCRVDELLTRFPDRLRHQRIKLHVQGREREVCVASAEVLLRGVGRARPVAARVIVVVVPRSKLKPWYLLTTDMGRSGQGVRRWPLFLCAAQMVLKFVASGVLKVALPRLNWSWYEQENTVGQMRRRLVEF